MIMARFQLVYDSCIGLYCVAFSNRGCNHKLLASSWGKDLVNF